METVVIDTNCLLAILPSKSPYHNVWQGLVEGRIALCVSNEILMEYEEILSSRIPQAVVVNVIQTILNLPNLLQVHPTYFFELIKEDIDDNKFVDCAICGEVELIVANDAHFNVLKTIDFPKVIIKDLKSFAELL